MNKNIAITMVAALGLMAHNVSSRASDAEEAVSRAQKLQLVADPQLADLPLFALRDGDF